MHMQLHEEFQSTDFMYFNKNILKTFERKTVIFGKIIL